MLKKINPLKVSIHASSREDATKRQFYYQRELMFQSTRPRGRTRPVLTWLVILCFNPRVLAGGRDIPPEDKERSDGVSIHASSREDATCLSFRTFSLSSFNPRVLAGGRDRYSGRWRRASGVSIHASSREDATITLRSRSIRSRFNPRVLAGGRDERKVFIIKYMEFQSTRPRGRTRPVRRSPPADDHGFNPRVLAGGRDKPRLPSVRSEHVSIHASSREDATPETNHNIA